MVLGFLNLLVATGLTSAVLLPNTAVAVGAESDERAVPDDVGALQVRYRELLARPDQFVQGEVRLHVQFHSLLFDWDPYITRFAPTRYLGITAWADEQMTWEREAYEQPAVRVFIDRDDPEIGHFLRARRHTRFELTCRVRAFLGGDVWIEVTGVRPAREHLPEGSVLHAIRGRELAQNASYELALGEFERALAAPVPEHVREQLESFVRACEEAHELRVAARIPVRRTGRDTQRVVRDKPFITPPDVPLVAPRDEPAGQPIDEPESRPVDRPQGKPIDEPGAGPLVEPVAPPVEQAGEAPATKPGGGGPDGSR